MKTHCNKQLVLLHVLIQRMFFFSNVVLIEKDNLFYVTVTVESFANAIYNAYIFLFACFDKRLCDSKLYFRIPNWLN